MLNHKQEYDKSIEMHEKSLCMKHTFYKSNPNHSSIAENHNNLGEVYRAKGEYDDAEKHFHKALGIYEVVYKSNPNHPSIANVYNNLGLICMNKEEYKKAIEYCKKTLKIYKVVHESDSNHPVIVKIYQNLGIIFIKQEKFKESLYYVSQTKNQAAVNMVKLVCGNQALLNGNDEQAREWYSKINPIYRKLNFYSEKFIKLQFENIPYNSDLLSAAINIQKTLLFVDPKLNYKNYYHYLARFYKCKGDVNNANEAFLNSLKHPKANSGLYTEYAQFLILIKNSSALNTDLSQITKYLYSSIECNNIGGLQYGKPEQNTICKKLCDIIKAKNATISIHPKVLAYYLLITNPEYIKEGDNIEDLFNSLRSICDNLQDEVGFELLIDAYKYTGNEKLATEYSDYSNTISQVNKIIEGKLKIDDKNCNINLEEVQKYAANIDKLSTQALFDQRLDDLSKLYTKAFQIYNLILIDEKDHLQIATNNLATFSLLTNNVKQFITLKLQFNTQLNQDLIKSLGLDVSQIINIENQISAQILVLPRQSINNQDFIEDNDSDQVSAIGDNNHDDN